MYLLNPKKPDFSKLDEKSRKIMEQTIEFFETKGKKKLKADDLNRVWYSDFVEFQGKIGAFATFMTPKGYGDVDSRWDSHRISVFSEILGFYGLAYWYTWQVSMLGLGPIWMSKNEKIKQRASELLKKGAIFAFGLSEKEHGADLINTDMMLEPQGDGKYLANGDKYYIGNGNKAAIISTFGKMSDSGKFVFFALESSHTNYRLIKNVVPSQNFVSEFEVTNYPITEEDIISKDREAWDASLATVAFCKYNLGWASIGICTHAFYEALNHSGNRKLYGDYVTEFPHIKQLFLDAYMRLVAMRLFTSRAFDYMRSASDSDRRYLLYNPMVKMKVTIQGEEVINLLWDAIAAKGFEADTYFETAARDIRGLPKLEGTAHVNMVLINNFIEQFLFEPTQYPEIPERTDLADDSYLFHQGATTKGLKKIKFHDYKKAYNFFDTPNIKVFLEQVEAFKHFWKDSPISTSQARDLDYMLAVGEMFTLVPYGQLILERAQQWKVEKEVIDRIFDFMVRDFSKYAVQVYTKPSTTSEQMKNLLSIIKQPITKTEDFEYALRRYVYSQKGAYEMNP
jgi:acyl-CoA dehydrogenase